VSPKQCGIPMNATPFGTNIGKEFEGLVKIEKKTESLLDPACIYAFRLADALRTTFVLFYIFISEF